MRRKLRELVPLSSARLGVLLIDLSEDLGENVKVGNRGLTKSERRELN